MDVWVILFSVLLYSSVHNINYGYLKLNNVHSLHHNNPFTNLGPDICDIIFGSKHNSNSLPENTNHHIPNMIVVTSLILLLRYLIKVGYVDINCLLLLTKGFLFSGGFICITSSLYLFLKREKEVTLHSLFTRLSNVKHY